MRVTALPDGITVYLNAPRTQEARATRDAHV